VNGWSKTAKIIGVIVGILTILAVFINTVATINKYKIDIENNTHKIENIDKKVTSIERKVMIDITAIRAYLKALVDAQGLKVEIPDSAQLKKFHFRGEN
jgi:Na+-transporting methylmalonyl-CoA/oxaloacetate decarboxylase gamma subunit